MVYKPLGNIGTMNKATCLKSKKRIKSDWKKPFIAFMLKKKLKEEEELLRKSKRSRNSKLRKRWVST